VFTTEVASKESLRSQFRQTPRRVAAHLRYAIQDHPNIDVGAEIGIRLEKDTDVPIDGSNDVSITQLSMFTRERMVIAGF
jgi:hypothetical protein